MIDFDTLRFLAELRVFMGRHVNSESGCVDRAMTYLAPLQELLRQEVEMPQNKHYPPVR